MILHPMKQFRCIYIDLICARQLRDVVASSYERDKTYGITEKEVVDLCKRLYEALRHLTLTGIDAINVELTENECFYLNLILKQDDSDRINDLLIQTWQVLEELQMPEPTVIDLFPLSTDKPAIMAFIDVKET